MSGGNDKIVEDEKTLIEKFKDNGMQVDELTDEQLEPFKELIKEPMNERSKQNTAKMHVKRLVSIQKA